MFRDKEQVLEWLYSIPLNDKSRRSDTLERIKKLVNSSNIDLSKLPKIIQITGTNGKTSVGKFTQTILSNMGFKTGFFSSPHIDSFNERIQVDEKKINDEELISNFNLIFPYVENQTQFEIIFTVALMFFSKSDIDVLIIEVGIGGIFDSTNIIDSSVAVITSIGLDHQNILGNTIEKIAEQKVGIVKKTTDAIILGKNIPPKAKNIIEQTAKKTKTKFGQIKNKLKVNVKYQQNNAAVAWATAKTFIFLNYRDKYLELVDKYSTAKLIKLLNETKIPARFEIISENPLVIIDGAHNQLGVDVLIDSLVKDFGDKEQLIFVGSNKNHYFDTDSFKQLPLAKVFEVSFESPVSKIDDFSNWEKVFDVEKLSENQIVVFTGSLYFVAEVRKKLKKIKKNAVL